jgi:hypothetical protein
MGEVSKVVAVSGSLGGRNFEDLHGDRKALQHLQISMGSVKVSVMKCGKLSAYKSSQRQGRNRE